MRGEDRTLKADKREPKARRGKPRRLRRLLLWPPRLAAYAVAAAILWVASYAAINPPGGYYMAAEWVRLGAIQRDWEDLDAISTHLARAVMAAEDANFCDHFGFDLAAIRKAFDANAGGKRLRGASTISQQVAKNVFLWHGRSWPRKGLEAGFTVLIEAIWTKRRILEVYLNTVEFGEGVFGAEAAARHYFSRAAADLTLDQAARLAAVLPDPKDRSPGRATAYMNRRAAAIAGGARTLEGEGRDGCAL
jgi:monofunctional biosynthetic peptidoglycan transglycosylase